MIRKTAYAVGILALTLSMGCPKHIPPFSISNENIEKLVAWVPEEAEVVGVVLSLEGLVASHEQLKVRTSWQSLTEGFERFQEKLAKETGLDFFLLSTWKEMGLNVRAPLMLSTSIHQNNYVFALPVSDWALFFAAIEKHLVNRNEFEALPDMPEGLRAWSYSRDKFMVVSQKPGYALILLGEDLETLQKLTQLTKENSWAKHRDVLLKTHARLPQSRVMSVWARIEAEKSEEVKWVGVSVGVQPRPKVVVDLTWREGKEPLFPAMQAGAFSPQQWPEGLGDAMVGVWSSVEWDWYAQLFKRQSIVRELSEFDVSEKLGAFKQDFESPVLLKIWPEEAAKEEGAKAPTSWSVDFLLKQGNSAEQALRVLALLLSAEAVTIEQPDSDSPIWKAQAGKHQLMAQALGENKVRIASNARSFERDASNVLQKALIKEMMNFPVAAVFHLNAVAKVSALSSSSDREQFEKPEYVLLGLRAEEGHAQFIGEHFIETDFQ